MHTNLATFLNLKNPVMTGPPREFRGHGASARQEIWKTAIKPVFCRTYWDTLMLEEERFVIELTVIFCTTFSRVWIACLRHGPPQSGPRRDFRGHGTTEKEEAPCEQKIFVDYILNMQNYSWFTSWAPLDFE